jgi:transcriptional regulator with XRE-family HTH domain
MTRPPKSTLPFQRRDLPVWLGGTLKAVRVGQRRSRQGVAKTADIAPLTLARIERGDQAPTPATLERICCALGIDVWDVARRWSRDAAATPTDPEISPGLGLRALRRERDLPLTALAARSGVSVSTLSRFERGITVSRRLTAGPAAGSGGQERDVVIDSLPLARAFNFQTVEELRSACISAALRKP